MPHQVWAPLLLGILLPFEMKVYRQSIVAGQSGRLAWLGEGAFSVAFPIK
jgi:hypothetical protein